MNQEIINFDSNKIGKVVLSNKLAEAESRLSYQEFRVLMMMISAISYEDQNFKPIRIDTEEYAKICHLKGNSANENLKEAALGLLSKKLIIREKESTLYTYWIVSARSFKKKGYVEMCFHPELMPHLLQLRKEFNITELEYLIVRLRSVYSAKIYILMKQYLNCGEREIEVEQLKRILGIIFFEGEEGKEIAKDRYKNFSDFEKNVLLPAKSEINEKTDLEIKYDISAKERKKITKLFFTINLKEKNNISREEKLVDSEKVIVGHSPSKAELEDAKFLENDSKKNEKNNLTSIEEIKEYWTKKGYKSNYEKFFNHYKAKGWKGIKDRSAVADNWELNFKEKNLDLYKNTLNGSNSESIIALNKPISINNDDPLWLKLSEALKNDFEKEVFDKWLSKLNFVDVKEGDVTLATDTKFLRDWIKREYLKNILSSFQQTEEGLKSINIIHVELQINN